MSSFELSKRTLAFGIFLVGSTGTLLHGEVALSQTLQNNPVSLPGSTIREIGIRGSIDDDTVNQNQPSRIMRSQEPLVLGAGDGDFSSTQNTDRASNFTDFDLNTPQIGRAHV